MYQTEMTPGPRKFLDAKRAELAGIKFDRIETKSLSPTIGAEISGVDLREPLDPQTFDEVERALHAFKVIFFRDQPITIQQQLAFAEQFGELEEHPFLRPKDGHGEVIRFEKDEEQVGVENIWHSDVSWREVPSLGSVLHAVAVPEVGGDTLWADMEAAYQGLPGEVRERIDGMTAVHDFTSSFGYMLNAEQLAEKQKEHPAVEHPVVRTHAATGRKSLYVNSVFTSHLVGVPADEGSELLTFLYRQASYPEYQCRLRWEKDPVAFWDNRQCQHYAASDYWPQQRVMERVTVIGERPV
jgi:taurine dioxygenase